MSIDYSTSYGIATELWSLAKDLEEYFSRESGSRTISVSRPVSKV